MKELFVTNFFSLYSNNENLNILKDAPYESELVLQIKTKIHLKIFDEKLKFIT